MGTSDKGRDSPGQQRHRAVKDSEARSKGGAQRPSDRQRQHPGR